MEISFNFIKNCNVHFMRLARRPSTVKANMQSQFLFIPICACKISIIWIVVISYQLTLLNFNWTNRTVKNRLNNWHISKGYQALTLSRYGENRIFQIIFTRLILVMKVWSLWKFIQKTIFFALHIESAPVQIYQCNLIWIMI